MTSSIAGQAVSLKKKIMEDTRNFDDRHRDDARRNENPENDQILNDDGYNVIAESNKDVAGRDRSEQNSEDRKHHQTHGIKRYKLFDNRTSHDDQPMTDTGV
jgi:hypothetical protein